MYSTQHVLQILSHLVLVIREQKEEMIASD